jgi:hypothetical protein
MLMSRTGLCLSVLYLVASAAAVFVGVFAATDPKSRNVFIQVPVMVQGALVYSMGLGAHLRGLSWPMAYLLLGVPTLALLYAVGALIDRTPRNDGDAV